MWKKLALGLVAVIVLLAAVVALQPASFAVERTARIQAPTEVVYGHIASLRAMDRWSPFAQMDPEMKISYEGPEAGVGAVSSWDGPQMGTGRLTITGALPPQQIEMRLEMRTPMQADNRILFTLAPADSATQVTWRMEGRNGFLGKAIGLVVDMDAMVGGDFEKGLAALKASAERDAREQTAGVAHR